VYVVRETPEQSERRRAHPVLGTPGRAVVWMRRLARHWRARVIAGLQSPQVGRLRREARTVRDRDYVARLLALGRWLRAGGYAEEYWRGSELFPELIASFTVAHTTCTCTVCGDGRPEHGTCQFVAVCRAASELFDLISLGPGRELVRSALEVMNALWNAAYQIADSDPEAEARFQQLTQDPDEVERMVNQPEYGDSEGLEFSMMVLRRVALELRAYGLDRCEYCQFSLRSVGVTGPGAPERERGPEQHLELGGLQFVQRGRRIEVARLKRRLRKRPGMRDHRVRFIRAKTSA